MATIKHDGVRDTATKEIPRDTFCVKYSMEQVMKRVAAIISSVLALSGCVTGITTASPSKSVDTETTYQEAYRRADAFARTCHSDAGGPLVGSFTVSGNLYSDNQTGVVRVRHPSASGDLMRVDIKATSNGASSIAWVAGIGMWDQKQLDAITKTIQTGEIACR